MEVTPSWTQTDAAAQSVVETSQPLPSLNALENVLGNVDSPCDTSDISSLHWNQSYVSAPHAVENESPVVLQTDPGNRSASHSKHNESQRPTSADPAHHEPQPNSLALPEPTLSATASKLLGRHVPDNTVKATNTALNAFVEFVVEAFTLFLPKNLQELKDRRTPLWRRKSLREQAVGLTRIYLFRTETGMALPDDTSLWTDKQLNRINTVLVEFIATRKSTREGENLSPLTLRSYIAGLQRAFKSKWGYELNLFSGKVFSDPEKGLATALDNKIRQQQANGVCRKSHNILTEENIVALYKSAQLSKSHPKGFLTRMIFNIALMTAFRKSELNELRLQDVTKVMEGTETVYRFVGRIGSSDGASKTQSGGLKWINSKPKEVFVWNRKQLHGIINVYAEIEEYITLISSIREPQDKFFCAINLRGSTPSSFFKPQNISSSTLVRYMSDAFADNKIIGVGVRRSMTLHGLRSTVITQLFRAGMGDASVALRSGHRDHRSFLSYTNLRGSLGKRQQEGILGGFSEPSSKRKEIEDNDCEKKTFNALAVAEVGRVYKENEAPKEHSSNRSGRSTAAENKAGVVFRETEVPVQSFLNNRGQFTGNVTINVNYGVGAGKLGTRDVDTA